MSIILSIMGVMTALAYNVATQEQLNAIVEAPAGVEFEVVQNSQYPWTVDESGYLHQEKGSSSSSRLDLKIKTDGFYDVKVEYYRYSGGFYLYTDWGSTSASASSGTVSMTAAKSAYMYFGSTFTADYIKKITISPSTELTTITLNKAGDLAYEVMKRFSAFSDVKYLKVSGPTNDDDVNTIKQMTGLKYLDMSGISATSLPQKMFYDQDNIRTIILPDGVKEIPSSFAWGAGYLVRVEAPYATSIGSYAFEYCSRLTDITLKRVEKINNSAFNGCSSLKSATLPALTSIGNRAFYECTALETVELSDKLTALSENCFYGCTALKSVTLPASIAALPNGVFDMCTNIRTIEINAPAPPSVGTLPFAMEVQATATLVVQEAALNSYKTHPYWSKYYYWRTSTNKVTDLVLQNELALDANSRLDKVNLTLNGTSALTIDGTKRQEFKEVEIKANDTQSGQVISNCGNVSADGTKVTYTMSGSKWYFFSLPFDARIEDMQNSSDAQTAIYYYDGAKRAANGTGNSWTRIKSGTLTRGTGYIMQISKASDITFTSTAGTINDLFSANAFSKALAANTSSTSANNGWNFVGNPFASYYNIYYLGFTAPITVWTGSTYTAYSIADDKVALKPLQPFFVQCPAGTSTITFATDGRQTSSVIASAAQAKTMSLMNVRKVVDVTIYSEDGTEADRTRVVYNGMRSDNYEQECDAAKMMSEDASVPQIFSEQDGIAYAINEGAHANGKVALTLYIPADGTYTIKSDRNEAGVSIYNAETKEMKSLYDGITIDAQAGTLQSVLFLVDEDPTGVNEVAEQADADDAMYNLSGMRISKAAGIYVKGGKKYVK